MKKNIKKLFLLLAVIATAVVCFAFSAGALEPTGQCGDDVYWSYNAKSGELTISGNGPMWDYKLEYAYHMGGTLDYLYTSSPFGSEITKIFIEDNVTSISRGAFAYCYDLVSVSIPDSVTKIDFAGFFGCDSLKSVIIPDSVEIIEDVAFYGCTSLTTVELPENIETLSSRVFYDCDSLNDITIPDNVTTIEAYAFYSCGDLDNIAIPDNVTTIESYAFASCSGFKSIVIPDAVSSIGNSAFHYCTNLKYVIISDGVKVIDASAFSYCKNLERIEIPRTVTDIKSYAFVECISLTDVDYTGTEEEWSKINIESNNGYLKAADIHYNSCSHSSKTAYPKQNATCTSIGYTDGVYCNDCKEWIIGHNEIKMKEHVFTEKIIDSKHLKSKATVEKAATYKYDCAVCDAISESSLFYYGKKLTVGTPSKLTATPGTSTIKLTWNKAANATGYRIYYKLPADLKWRQCVSYVTAVTYTFKNLPSGEKYSFAVKSIYKKSNGDYVEGGYTEINTATKAAKPSKVTATNTTSSITLSWPVCKGATGYRIYYKSNGAWKVTVSTTSATSHTFKNLKAGAKYTFAIRPYIKNGSTVVWSDYTEFMTATKPATVTAKTSSPSKGKITLSWNQVNGADGYQIYYKTGNGSYKLYKTVGKTTKSMSFSNLKSGTKYTFVVRAGIKTSGGNIYGAYKGSAVTVK